MGAPELIAHWSEVWVSMETPKLVAVSEGGSLDLNLQGPFYR